MDKIKNTEPMFEESSSSEPMFKETSAQEPMFEETTSSNEPMFEESSAQGPMFEEFSSNEPMFEEKSSSVKETETEIKSSNQTSSTKKGTTSARSNRASSSNNQSGSSSTARRNANAKSRSRASNSSSATRNTDSVSETTRRTTTQRTSRTSGRPQQTYTPPRSILNGSGSSNSQVSIIDILFKIGVFVMTEALTCFFICFGVAMAIGDSGVIMTITLILSSILGIILFYFMREKMERSCSTWFVSIFGWIIIGLLIYGLYIRFTRSDVLPEDAKTSALVGNYSLILDENKQGLAIEKDGKKHILLESKYDSIGCFYKTEDAKELFVVKENNKYGIADAEGKILIDVDYDKIIVDLNKTWHVDGKDVKYIEAFKNDVRSLYDFTGKHHGDIVTNEKIEVTE